jgi:hypothetical protein
MATAKLRRVVRVGFLLRAALLVTRVLTATAFAAGPAIAQGATWSAATATELHGAILAGKAVTLAGFVATLPWPTPAARAILSWVEDLGRIA